MTASGAVGRLAAEAVLDGSAMSAHDRARFAAPDRVPSALVSRLVGE